MRPGFDAYLQLIRTDPTRLTRAGLIRVLRDGPQSMRPPRLHQQSKAELLAIVQKALTNVILASVVAPLIRREVAADAHRPEAKTPCTTSPSSASSLTSLID
jgi:hypothetical protein